MATHPQPRRQPYTLYATNGRVYVSNVDGALVDLGPLAPQGAGWSYRLEGSELTGDGFDGAEAALHHIASRLHFLWVDGQFTAQRDVRGEVDLAQAVRLDIELDELGPNTPVMDATV